MADKVLSFSIKVDGISNEAIEFQKLIVWIKNTKKEIQELEKAAKKGIASEEQLKQLAAYKKHLDEITGRQKELGKVMDAAPGSLVRLRAELDKLNATYIRVDAAQREQMAPGIKKINDEILKAEAAIGRHQRNVGNYPELFEAIPGPVGAAATSIQSFGTTIKTVFLTNPLGIIILGITTAVAGLISVFSKFTPVVEAVERVASGVKAVFGGIANTIVGLVTGQNTLKESFNGLGSSIKKAYDEGEKWRQLEQDLFEMTTQNAVADARRKTQMDELLLASKNRTKSEAERMQLLNQYFLIEEVQFNERKKIADAEVSLAEQALTKGRNFTDEELRLLRLRGVEYANELKMKKRITEDEIKAYSDALVAQERVNNESVALRERAENRLDQILDKAEAKRIKRKEEEEKAIKKVRDQEILAEQEGQKFIEQEIKRMDQETDIKWNKEVEFARKLFDFNKKQAEEKYQLEKEAADKIEKLKIDKEKRVQAYVDAGFQGSQMGADAAFNSKRSRLQAEMEAELSNVNLTEQQKVAIRKKYGKEQQKMDVTQAIINGALAVGKAAFNIWPVPAIPMIALAALTTGIQVAAIKAQKYATGGKITGGMPVYTGTKDDTLIAVNKSETVLTQDHVQRLGGSAMMRHIRVPGYELGGYTGQRAPEIPSPGFDYSQISKMINGIQVTLEINKLNKAQKELNIITEPQRI